MTAGLIAVLVFVMGWFAIGSIRNVRKGSATLRWFQEGLPLLGQKTTVRWLGTTSVELAIAKAKPPFDSASLVVFLEPRDVPWIWAASRRRGRRDTLIVRGRTKRRPLLDLEVLDPGSWSAREARRRMAAESWPDRESGSVEGLEVFARGQASLPLAAELLRLAREGGMTVRRLSVRQDEPHVQLHVDLPGPPMPAARFFQAVRAIGERAMEAP